MTVPMQVRNRATGRLIGVCDDIGWKSRETQRPYRQRQQMMASAFPIQDGETAPPGDQPVVSVNLSTFIAYRQTFADGDNRWDVIEIDDPEDAAHLPRFRAL